MRRRSLRDLRYSSLSGRSFIEKYIMGSYFPYLPPKGGVAKIRFRCLLWVFVMIFFVLVVLPTLFGLVFGLDPPVEQNEERSKLPLTVDLGYSKYQGFENDNGVSHWFGVRFAAPPLGDLRFRAPIDPPSTGDVVHIADAHAPLCHFSPSTGFDPGHSEDCLLLDVYAPSNSNGHHPVYVFLQGGGLNALTNPNINPSRLIPATDHDLVVVTFNFRVGPWGFLNSKEVRENGDLNAGLLDQRQVLKWIQKHIASFGGDPNKVILGGGSAGAGSVALHLTSYGGRDDGLFHAATSESASLGSQLTVEESQYQYDALVARVKCNETADSLQCLRDLPIQTLAENNPDLPSPGGAGGNSFFMWSSCIDGNFTENNTYSMYDAGRFRKIPIIFGDDTNEGTLFTPRGLNSQQEMNDFMKNNFPKLTDTDIARIDDMYPNTSPPYPEKGAWFRTTSDVFGDIRYSCPAMYVSAAYSNAGVKASYNYNWDVLNDAKKENGMGVTHTAELAAIWGLAGPGSIEEAYGPVIGSYFISFLRTVGDPNKLRQKGAPEWTTFDASEMKRLTFTNSNGATLDAGGVSMQSVPNEKMVRCQYLYSLAEQLGQ